ncbi:hypothetical protein BpHYR1_010988 [Brachionus plicatilis]|uniref:Uncharacterized protein n=1 Tax=Brachionus plicatilis TaxID=10195 RepID=A0A3M7T1B5_BRAPC|nr:hypothetical protein BpHYR1_010988 [Brachionus plicatilis]
MNKNLITKYIRLAFCFLIRSLKAIKRNYVVSMVKVYQRVFLKFKSCIKDKSSANLLINPLKFLFLINKLSIYRNKLSILSQRHLEYLCVD